MADEQALVEPTTTEVIQEQTPETTVESSSEEPAVESTGRGDLSEALRQEREKRQALEANLADPSFIYNQAKTLGLTEEEAKAVEAQNTPTEYQPEQPAGMTYNDYQYFKSLDKAKDAFPQLETDQEDQVAVTAIMQAFKLLPDQAAARYYAKLNKVADVARTEGAKAKETTISEKEQAQTVTSTASTNSDSAEYEELLARSRNQMKPKDADKAHLELLKWREKHR